MSKIHIALRVACLLLLLGLLALGVGITYGRYSSNLRESVVFEAQKQDADRAIAIQSTGWQTTDARATLTFTLAGAATDQYAALRLTATEGFSSQGASVTLTVGDTVYRGTAETIESGDPLYDKMGPGTEYRFYTDGAECRWPVGGSDTYTLTVEGDADASLLRLTATEI